MQNTVIDFSCHERCFASVRDTTLYRTIKCSHMNKLYCVVLVLDNWKNVYTITESQVTKFGKMITLEELKNEICRA